MVGVKVGIVGAGMAGLTAAHELLHRGHEVTVYEMAKQVGGLASGFRDHRWDWPLERFYHHIFEGDHAIRSLTQRVGYGDRLFFRRGITAHYWQGSFYPLDGPLEVLRFPGLPFLDRLRFGLVSFYLKYLTTDWRSLERHTAVAWSQRWMGKSAYHVIMQPLLEGKMGPYAAQVNMAWLWARLRARSFKLGYYHGGFQGFADALARAVREGGGTILLETPVWNLSFADGVWSIQSAAGSTAYDCVIVTGAPKLLPRLVPQLPPEYLGRLETLASLGAVVLVLALKRKLTERFYWLQGMRKETFPFLALVEHTNFIEPEHYGGDHLVYCGDYLPETHEYFRLSKDDLLARVLPSLKGFNQEFHPDWIRETWLFREPYAQPIVGVNHSEKIPPLSTPFPGLFWASMSHVYPWDRGTNYAVELGQRVVQELLTEQEHERR